MASTTNGLRQGWLLLAIASCAMLLGSCRSTGDSAQVTVQFGSQNARERVLFLSTYDLAVLSYGEAYSEIKGSERTFDLEISYDSTLDVACNGTRNILYVGNADEAAFRRLVAALDRWAIPDLPEMLSAAGVAPSGKGSYWTPTNIPYTPGMIVATRNVRSAGDDGNIGALIYFKSLGDNELVLLVAREPTRGRL